MRSVETMSTETHEHRVLVVEDDPDIRELVERRMVAIGVEVRSAGNGRDALRLVADWDPQLLVLDIGLPDIDGVEVCRRLRETSDAYVIFLSARGAESDRILGLAVGGDDYVLKPFSAGELALRVQAGLRRVARTSVAAAAGAGAGEGDDGAVMPAAKVLEVGDLALDLGAFEARLNGELVGLTRIEFELLAALAEHRGMVLTREQLMERVWGDNWYGDTHVVDVHLSNVRRKLGDSGRTKLFVVSVRGIGFKIGSCIAAEA
jgi:DNA-binding response OmpR family regulator